MNNKPSSCRVKGAPPAGGFTLVELAVTMVIAAVLAAIAIPAYSNYVRKAHRAEAKSTVLDLASLEERYFTTNNNYTDLASNLGYSGTGTTTAGGTFTVGSGYYTVVLSKTDAVAPTTALPGGTPAWYSITATATAVGNQLKDTSCKTFTVNSAGVQTAADAASAVNTANCW
jgi:type IV pilus assembly protein PilE